MKYQPVIGLEVHVHLDTKTKCFCGCSTEFGQKPNSQTCPVCLGLPGSLPVLNGQALRLAIKAALALHGEISSFIKFDRKNYFYPDLPKNFQISQYELPLSHHGWLEISGGSTQKKIRIRRTHLEEDAGKLIHLKDGTSLIDFNRSGVPLLEIVSEPDLGSAEEAYEYLTRLKVILEYLEVSDCNMEQGSLRCDANISVAPKGGKVMGEKVELKNMNSFKGVKEALEYEVQRQTGLLDKKRPVVQQTRLWDADRGTTVSMRSKEEEHDYRYFPEPDLVPTVLDAPYIQEIKQALPELPQAKQERFVRDYQLPQYDAAVLTQDKYLADYFEACVRLYPRPKLISNWLMTELLAHLKTRNIEAAQLPLKPESFVDIFRLMDAGQISGKMAKELLPQMLDAHKEAEELIRDKGFVQITDAKELQGIIQQVIAENPKPVNDYHEGKENALMFLIGQIMQKSRGQANPKIVDKILKEKLERRDDA